MNSSPIIRQFRWEDLPQFTQLFNNVNMINNSEKALSIQDMKEFLEQPTCNPETNCFVAEQNKDHLGFVIVTPELPIKRAVLSGGVRSICMENNIETNLIEIGIDHARSLGASLLHIQASARNEKKQSHLYHRGFRIVGHFWRMLWENHHINSVAVPEEFILRSFIAGKDENDFTNLQNDAFRGSWGFCPNTVEDIVASTQFSRFDPKGIILLVHGTKLAGYNWTKLYTNDHGTTGMVFMTGVHPKYRGKGLGRVIVSAGMEYLINQNVLEIELEVDSSNVPATNLYTSLGYRKVSESIWYELPLLS